MMKPYLEDNFMGTGVPLYFHQGMTRSSVLGEKEDMVEEILRHRMHNGRVEFLVRWKNDPTEDSWESSTAFIQQCSKKWLDYISLEGLETHINELFAR